MITGSSTSVTGAQTAASTVGGVITGSSASVTGTVTGASLAGTITTASQTNITSVGTLGSLSVTGTVTAASLAGTITTASQTNITAVGSLGSTQISSLGVGTAASGTSGEIRATNNVTAYYSSDAKFKENVKTIPNALDAIDAIGGKLFDWTDEYLADHGGEDGYFVQKSDFGVIAQDVQAVFPLAVRTRPDGSLAVDYEKLSALAFAAIVELRAEINALKKSS